MDPAILAESVQRPDLDLFHLVHIDIEMIQLTLINTRKTRAVGIAVQRSAVLPVPEAKMMSRTLDLSIQVPYQLRIGLFGRFEGVDLRRIPEHFVQEQGIIPDIGA